MDNQMVEALERRQLWSVSIQLDYSFDSNGFFADANRRSVLEAAASTLSSRLGDTLSAITPGSGNSWKIVGHHPAQAGQQFTVDNPTIPADVVRIYAGGQDLPGTTLGRGGPTGWSGSGVQSWFTTIRTRGETGAAATPKTDYAPFAGSITFDTTSNWHFGTTRTGLDSTKSDFFSVAVHELAHVLGIGSAEPWDGQINSSGAFVGSKSSALYGGAVPIDPTRGHWAEGTRSAGRETAMDPTLTRGTRKEMTPLDFAGLDDIGWDILPAGTIASASLVNAGDDAIVGTISNGQTINLNDYSGGISVRANPSGAVRSVQFKLNGNVIRTENAGSPYTLASESGTNILPFNFGLGTQTLTMTPYTGTFGTGEAGPAKTMTFNVIKPQTLARVNATNTAITIGDGRTFATASGFSGGVESGAAFAVANTTDDSLFYTRRSGRDFSFNRSVANGNYTVLLSFAEPTFTASGQRKFDVLAENVKVLGDYDLVAVGGAKAAVTRSIPVTVTDGQLNLRFLGKVGDALVSAITIAPRLEAEQATRSGPTVATQYGGFTGSGYADYQGATGEFVQWNASVATAGKHRLIVRYANGTATNAPLKLTVNGVTVNASLAFNPTGSWTAWRTVEVMVNLSLGANAVRLTSIGSGGPNVDSLSMA